jgi:hypothetical protein
VPAQEAYRLCRAQHLTGDIICTGPKDANFRQVVSPPGKLAADWSTNRRHHSNSRDRGLVFLRRLAQGVVTGNQQLRPSTLPIPLSPTPTPDKRRQLPFACCSFLFLLLARVLRHCNRVVCLLVAFEPSLHSSTATIASPATVRTCIRCLRTSKCRSLYVQLPSCASHRAAQLLLR